MNREVIKYVKTRMKNSSHDFEHALRVSQMANTIALHLGDNSIDFNVLKYSCFLHDIARTDIHLFKSELDDHAEIGAKQAYEFLISLNDPDLGSDRISKICECIKTHRFRSSMMPNTIEAKILFDADKIDALGAIGLARTFSWLGEHKKRLFQHSNIRKDSIEYKSAIGKRNRSCFLGGIEAEYHSKLKYIPEAMHSKYAYNIAQKRLSFIEQFIKELRNEFI